MPQISYTKLSEKIAYLNSAYSNQTVPGLLRVYTVSNSTKYFKKKMHKKQNLGQPCKEYKVFKFWGHLWYIICISPKNYTDFVSINSAGWLWLSVSNKTHKTSI